MDDHTAVDDHTVAGRVMAVLDAVAHLGEDATLAAVTRATGVPKPTVRRIAADLVARGVLRQFEDTFQLGHRLLELGVRAAAQHGLRGAAAPYLQDLCARTGEIAWTAAVTDTGFVILDACYGRNRVPDLRRPLPPSVRALAVLTTTAAGRAVLAERPDLVDQLRSRPLPAATRHTITSWPRLMAELDRVRDTGVAVEREEASLGYTCLASAIHDTDGTLIGVFGVTARAVRFPVARMIRPVRSAACEISGTLAPAKRGTWV